MHTVQSPWEWGPFDTSARGAESQEGVCESLKGPLSLILCEYFDFFYLLWYYQLFLVYLEKKLCKIYLNFWWKFTSGFIGPQIFNFERSLNLSAGP
jgi:hypothetical protein